MDYRAQRPDGPGAGNAALGMAANSDADYTAIPAQNLKRMRKQSVEAAVLKACGEGGHVQHH
jgi:hypothetical protein